MPLVYLLFKVQNKLLNFNKHKDKLKMVYKKVLN